MSPLLQQLVTYFDIHAAPSGQVDVMKSEPAQPDYVEEPLRFEPSVPVIRHGLLNAGDEFVAEMADRTGESRSTPPSPPFKAPTNNYSLFQWMALFAGIAIQPFFSHYQSSQTFSGAIPHPWQSLVVAMVIAIILFPAIYRRTFSDAGTSGSLKAKTRTST